MSDSFVPIMTFALWLFLLLEYAGFTGAFLYFSYFALVQLRPHLESRPRAIRPNDQDALTLGIFLSITAASLLLTLYNMAVSPLLLVLRRGKSEKHAKPCAMLLQLLMALLSFGLALYSIWATWTWWIQFEADDAFERALAYNCRAIAIYFIVWLSIGPALFLIAVIIGLVVYVFVYLGATLFGSKAEPGECCGSDCKHELARSNVPNAEVKDLERGVGHKEEDSKDVTPL